MAMHNALLVGVPVDASGVEAGNTAGRRQAGAGTAAICGEALGWLVSMGTVAVPGLGAFLAAGPLMAALPEWVRANVGF